MDTSIILETYNVQEGTSLESLRRALRVACDSTHRGNGHEVLLADVTGDPTVTGVLDEFPGVRLVEATGLSYGNAKKRAAEQARGRYLVYLDADCVPVPGWWENLTRPLREGAASATGGFSYYPGGFFPRLQSMLDFGFLFPRTDREMGCYASNNCAFVREVYLAEPEPDGPMRCRCYAHAQRLGRKGQALHLVAAVEASHEPPPVLRERLRQGYDMIAACWVDPELPEARWLKYGILALPLYYGRRLRLDYTTLRRHRAETRLSRPGAVAASLLIPFWRLLDGVGMAAALACGPRARPWVEPGLRGGPGRG